MPISERQLEANRANAQKSPGPQSPEAKAKVAQNATKHGLTGQFRVLACESLRLFDAMLERYLQIEQPADDIERDLVVTMTRHAWLADRALRCQDACFLVQPRSEENIEADLNGLLVHPDLERYMRYHSTHDRAYHRAAAALARRRKERIAAARGIVSQEQAAARETRSAELHPYRVRTTKALAENAEHRTFAVNSSDPRSSASICGHNSSKE